MGSSAKLKRGKREVLWSNDLGCLNGRRFLGPVTCVNFESKLSNVGRSGKYVSFQVDWAIPFHSDYAVERYHGERGKLS